MSGRIISVISVISVKKQKCANKTKLNSFFFPCFVDLSHSTGPPPPPPPPYRPHKLGALISQTLVELQAYDDVAKTSCPSFVFDPLLFSQPAGWK